jgi:acetyltransferase-like isoleucine patch superfamily enzyme
MQDNDVVIVSGARTPIGKLSGALKDFTAMDLGGIAIGDDVMIGPNAQLISSGHPLDPAIRRAQVTTARIHIGRGAWIAAGATVLQGVTVGDDAVVAAGAVVTKDVPARTLVAGVPAHVVREL